jgi:small subunit ribosomal protein S1
MDGDVPPELLATEDYWQALLEQGEFAVDCCPPEGEAAPGARAPDERLSHEGGFAPRVGCTAAARQRDDWQQLRTWQRLGQAFQASVIGCNKGGLLVRVGDGIGFVPASQLADLPRTLGTADLRTDLQTMVGREMTLRVIELDESRDRVICSERATHWDGTDVECRLQALDDCIGCQIEGVVRSLCEFGAFVDLGGIDGLIHISEISWQRINHPSEVLALNHRVKVMVLKVDHESRRVALSYKRLHADPWDLIGEHYAVGDVIQATVTNIVPFGAFARVAEGVEGLIHISELSDASFGCPDDVVAEGQCVWVRVLHIDPAARRLGLSMRQA